MEKAKTNKTAARKVERVLRPKSIELYDIVSDPYETNDLSSKPRHEQRIEAMHEKLKMLMSACGESTSPPRAGDPIKRKKGTK